MKAKINWQEMLPKSSVQDKFAVDKNKLWRSYFWNYGILPSLPIWIIGFVLFFVLRGPIFGLGVAKLLGVCTGFVFFFIDFYAKSNSAVESYFFDITDNFVMVIAKNLNFITPMRAVYKVSVEHQFFTQSYRVKIKSQFYKRPLYIMGFDEKTAHELKEYIVARMPNLES